MKNNENKELNDIILIGGGLFLVYVGVLRPLLKTFGVLNSDADNAVNAQATLPDSQNPFSVNWGANQSSDIMNPETAQLTVQDIQQHSGSNTLGVSTGEQYPARWAPLADQIYHAMGYLSIDENAVISAFNQLQYQSDVWQMSVYMQAKYGVDLFNWIKKGQSFTPWDNGITKDALAAIIQHINQLPVAP